MAESYLLDKLKSVEQTYNELTRRLADPDTARNPDEYQKVAKSRANFEEVVNTYEVWKTTQEELIGARQVLKEANGDPDWQEMAALEVKELEEKLENLEIRLKVLLLPPTQMMIKTSCWKSGLGLVVMKLVSGLAIYCECIPAMLIPKTGKLNWSASLWAKWVGLKK